MVLGYLANLRRVFVSGRAFVYECRLAILGEGLPLIGEFALRCDHTLRYKEAMTPERG